VYRNERGFTIAEGLVAFGAILFVATMLFPLMFHMMKNLENNKEHLLAYRFLYESSEQFMINDTLSKRFTSEGRSYETSITSFNGKWKACVLYDKKQNCITETEK